MNICLIGGTGSLGIVLLKQLLLLKYNVVVLARNENKINKIKAKYQHNQIKFIVADIKDKMTLDFTGIDYVIHLAALKHVWTGQEFPYEVVKTNIMGTQNIIDKCKEYKVKKLIYISTDKSVEPINVYGMTKHIAEKMIMNEKDLFTVVIRSGNIWGSSGSCIPYFLERKRQGKKIHLTDIKMERYFISAEKLATFIILIMEANKDKALYISKLKNIKIIDIIKRMKCDYEIIGKRDGEKLKEKLYWEGEKFNIWTI